MDQGELISLFENLQAISIHKANSQNGSGWTDKFVRKSPIEKQYIIHIR
jgi:hypothetical protein